MGVRFHIRLGVGLSIKLYVRQVGRLGSLAVRTPILSIRLGVRFGIRLGIRLGIRQNVGPSDRRGCFAVRAQMLSIRLGACGL